MSAAIAVGVWATAHTAQAAPPAEPSALQAEVLSSTKIRLTWQDNSTDERGFRLERSAAGGDFVTAGIIGPDATVFTDTWLTPGTTYTYRVVSHSGGGTSQPCAPVDGTTPSDVDPDNPLVSAMAPEIPLEHGNTHQLTGAQFGDKTPAEPLKWDDFESAAAGGLIGERVANGWYTEQREGDPPLYSDEYARGGASGVSVKQDYVTAGQYNCNFGLHVPEGSTEYFVSFHRYAVTQTGPDSGRNYKIMSLRTGGAGHWGTDDSHLEFRHDIYPYSESGHTHLGDCDSNNVADTLGHGYDLNQNRWERFDYYMNAGDLAVANGKYDRWLDGQVAMRADGGWLVRNGGCETWTNVYLNGYWARDRQTCTSGTNVGEWCSDDSECGGAADSCTFSGLGCELHGGCWANFWTDDVYIDTTRARVEVCDRAAWSQKTSLGAHCEIQVPKTWSPTEITFEVNQGAFGNDEPVWIFVVDRDGNVNEQGYEASFHSTGLDTTPPYRFDPRPSEPLPVGTSRAAIGLLTNEAATCRFATTADQAYEQMAEELASSDGTSHGAEVTGLTDGSTTLRYVRCTDAAGNANRDDFVITVTVQSPIDAAAGAGADGSDSDCGCSVPGRRGASLGLAWLLALAAWRRARRGGYGGSRGAS